MICRFCFKRFEIDKDQGFVFITNDGEKLKPNQLSSGEQQELVLFYQLLFIIPKGSLVLIDEPELSLHIEWQKRFIKDVARIAREAMFDVLIATHSSSIINEYWDLAIDLGVENNEQKSY